MIYTFRFISDEEDDFILDVNINHDQTFEDLHNAIQEALVYDPAQMTSFFTSNSEWEKLIEISAMEMEESDTIKSMQNTTIEACYKNKNERILYIFDFFSERLLFGSVVRMIDAKPPIDLPSVSRIEGKIPLQTMEIDEADMDLGSMEDIYGDSEDIMDNMDDFLPLDENEY